MPFQNPILAVLICGKGEVPEEVEFQTKPEIALDQIRTALAAQANQLTMPPHDLQQLAI